MKNTSRRAFLGQLMSAPLVSGAGRMLWFAMPGAEAEGALLPDAQSQFKHPEIIRYDAQCFTMHGKDTFIYSASFHYCRTPRELWRDRMMKLKLAGFNTIETYVFWNYHEPVEGQVDMAELEAFLTLTQELGLWMILRIGPYVCAEWDAGGFPHWLIAKGFPLRSDDPESIRTSRGWYDHVLPIVRKTMITVGGPVSMVQIENEYDYWHIPDEQKVRYITALAEMVWGAGVDVPIITNWVSQARENSNPVMARIMDTADFYPRWNIQHEVVPALAKLRREEPTSPVGIAELQGGWFSQYGGRLSGDQDGISAAQLNQITKTVIENGAAFTNFYMAHGGTNFNWAARKVTTTYDYAAPVREPGGLWDKYYAARSIGRLLDQYGPMVVRSDAAEPVTSTSHHVFASLRRNGKSAMLFVRADEDGEDEFQLTVPDPAGQSTWTIPREDKLQIGARAMKMLPVQVAMAGVQLRYSTVEVFAAGADGMQNYLFAYGEPGELAEIALAAEKKPTLLGVADYEHFDAASQTALFGCHIELTPQFFLWNDTLRIVILPRALMERSGIAVMQPAGDGQSLNAPVISDCVLMTASTKAATGLKMTLEYAPGEHKLCVIMPAAPTLCRVDGKPVSVEYDPLWQTARVCISTPQLPFQPVSLLDGEFLVETFDPAKGEWLHIAPTPLEKLGRLPYGYVKYRIPFEHRGQPMLSIDTDTADPKQVFLNGRRVAELSTAEKRVSCALDGFVRQGSNLLEISYEAFGSENGNVEMAELKGLIAVRLGDNHKAEAIDKVWIQRFPQAIDAHQLDLSRMSGDWKKRQQAGISRSDEFVPAYTWYRAPFVLSASPDWFAPWKITLVADRDALLYVNGKFVGYYKTIGPQTDFYVPEPYLHLEGNQENVAVVILAYTDGPESLQQLVVSPYVEFAGCRTAVEFV